MTKTKRVALYTRISTGEQRADLQLDELRELAAFRKWQIVGTYSDTISGSRDKRPALDKLLRDARHGKFDVVLVWRFDRFARSTKFLLNCLEEFNELDLDFVSKMDNVDTSTSMGKMIFTILGSVAELERNTMIERVKAGMAAARRRGAVFGRPRPKDAPVVDVSVIAKLRNGGASWRMSKLRLALPRTRPDALCWRSALGPRLLWGRVAHA